MSVKLDANSNVIGSYDTEDLDTHYLPPHKKPGKRRKHLREIEYDLVWNITEMQVKTFVRSIFPRAVGPLTMQLAQEQQLGPQELIYGESRSQGLIQDIAVSSTAPHMLSPQYRQAIQDNNDHQLDELLDFGGRQLFDDLVNEYEQPRAAIAPVTVPNQNTDLMMANTNATMASSLPLTHQFGMSGPHPMDSDRREGTGVSRPYTSIT